MKQKSTLAILFLFLLIKGASAAPLSGTYTVGGTTPNFATIQSAITMLQDSGVSGPVIFNIRAGTYNEKLLMGGAITGTSATNTVTFKSENGDSTSVIITDPADVAASNNFTWLNNGSDYIIIRNLTIERSGSNTYSTVLNIGGGTKFFQLKNCVIRGDENSNGSNDNKALIFFPLILSSDSSATISNCVLIGGTVGISMEGQSVAQPAPLIQITNNMFSEQSGRAIAANKMNKINIAGNTITTHNNTNYRGIYLTHALHNFTVTTNKITGDYTGDALYLDSCNGDAGSEGLIANNFFASTGTGASRGITLNQCASLHIYYNTVNISKAGTGNTNTALLLNNSGNSLINMRNNIFANTGGGFAYSMPANSVSNFSVADYNDLFAGAGASGLVRMDTSIFTILADWQTASSLDANSVSGNPQFTSDSDLHVSNAVVNANAVTIAGITTDIDGQTRNVTTPDIGADEFTPLANNIGLVSILAPVNGTCGDSATALIVVITNYGTGAQTGFTVDADITGTITQSLTETYSSSLTSNETDTIIFSQTLNTFAGDSIGVVVYTSLGSDQNRSNDTLTASFTLFGHPNPPTAVSPQPACDNNLQITATPDSGDALAWYDAASGGNLLYTGSVFSPTGVTTDTTFYVEARQGSGNVGCLRITEIMPDDNPISDYIEVQNVSGGIVNATGWVVVAGDNSGDINVFNDTLWQLGTFNPGEVQYRQDLSGDPNFWGQNIAWTGGTAGWAMILDNFGNVVDFVAWEFTAAEISAMNTVINGFNVTIGSEWSGDGYVSCSGNSNVRIGSSDNNDATDWSCEPPSEGTQNAGIASIFTNCGVGACGSARIPVDVTLVPGITVDLGNDTMIGNPFSIILDADTGYTSYLWSTGDTTQTITVTTYDTYWVTVTGGPNNCSATDSIVVSLNVGVTPTISRDEFSFYPNPAKDKLVIKGNEQFLQNAVFRITDISGKVALDASYIKSSGNSTIDISKLTNGVYFLQVIAGDRTGVQKFVVLK